MPSVLILQFAAHVPPGHFAASLTRLGVPWRVVRIDAGAAVPEALNGISGLGLMGGPMSANDDLPWIAPVLALVRRAVASGIPVIGHCLGGQLLARALGGSVGPSPVREIGWGRLDVADPATAMPWLGGMQGPLDAFQWHAESFSIPQGATRILAGAYCPNQAFVHAGRHLAMQFHVEMTPDTIADWCARDAARVAASDGRGVQAAADILAQLPQRIVRLHRLADALYAHWTRNLAGRAPLPLPVPALQSKENPCPPSILPTTISVHA